MSGGREKSWKASYPGVFISASAEIAPELFEHPRFSTAAINAVTGPVVTRYIGALATALKAEGYAGDLLILHSGGGVLTARGGASLCSENCIIWNCSRCDCWRPHCSRMRFCECNQPRYGRHQHRHFPDVPGATPNATNMVRSEYGHPIMFPSVEVITIGAGGGSIASAGSGWIAAQRTTSAGADPGPACYGKGGTAATNTDANLLLGRLGERLLDGRLVLDRRRASRGCPTYGWLSAGIRRS